MNDRKGAMFLGYGMALVCAIAAVGAVVSGNLGAAILLGVCGLVNMYCVERWRRNG